MMTKFDTVEEAKQIFDKEIDALCKTRDSLGHDFEVVENLILNCEGKVVLSGIG